MPARFAIVASLIIVFGLASLAFVVYNTLVSAYSTAWSILTTILLALTSLIVVVFGYSILKNSRLTGWMALALAIMITILALVRIETQALTTITEIIDVISVILSLFIIWYILRNKGRLGIR